MACALHAAAAMDERRHVMRVTPFHPMSARCDGEQAYVLDLSLGGLRLTHQQIIRSGTDCFVSFDWDGAPIAATAIVKWSRLQRIGRAAYATSLYESGVEILVIDERSSALLRECVEAHVARALDEQKANAKGIPPHAAQSQQRAAPSRFARHEYVNGLWRKVVTVEAEQPVYGFTVAAEQPAHEVSLLREAYACADSPTREIIRRLAQLSITAHEPIPIRKYTP